MKNKLTFATLVLLAGCAGPEVTQVMTPAGAGVSIECGRHGVDAGSWSECYKAAQTACASGYNVVDKSQEVVGYNRTNRSLLVTCKAG